MDKLDIILWVISAGFGVNFSLMMFMWHALNSKIESLEKRIDKLDEKITDIDRRLCRLEGAFSNKDCCMIKDSNKQKKAG